MLNKTFYQIILKLYINIINVKKVLEIQIIKFFILLLLYVVFYYNFEYIYFL